MHQSINQLINLFIKIQCLSRFASEACVYAPDLQQPRSDDDNDKDNGKAPVSSLHRMLLVSASACPPSTHINWLAATEKLRWRLARDFVWEKRRSFAAFWQTAGGPLAAAATFQLAVATTPEEEVALALVEAQRRAFMIDPNNKTFLLKRMTQVMFSANPYFRNNITSFI